MRASVSVCHRTARVGAYRHRHGCLSTLQVRALAKLSAEQFPLHMNWAVYFDVSDDEVEEPMAPTPRRDDTQDSVDLDDDAGGSSSDSDGAAMDLEDMAWLMNNDSRGGVETSARWNGAVHQRLDRHNRRRFLASNRQRRQRRRRVSQQAIAVDPLRRVEADDFTQASLPALSNRLASLGAHVSLQCRLMSTSNCEVLSQVSPAAGLHGVAGVRLRTLRGEHRRLDRWKEDSVVFDIDPFAAQGPDRWQNAGAGRGEWKVTHCCFANLGSVRGVVASRRTQHVAVTVLASTHDALSQVPKYRSVHAQEEWSGASGHEAVGIFGTLVGDNARRMEWFLPYTVCVVRQVPESGQILGQLAGVASKRPAGHDSSSDSAITRVGVGISAIGVLSR